MSQEASAVLAAERPRLIDHWALKLRPLAMAILPVLAALVSGGVVLILLGVDPIEYYSFVVNRGLLRPRGLQETITRTIPLMLLGSALIVSFRAGVWNLGIDGQFVLGTFAAAVSAPWLMSIMPPAAALVCALAFGAAVGAVWTIVPALLRAYQGINEVISTLMMTFVATSLASALIKLFFRDPQYTEPQTLTLPMSERLPQMFGTTVNVGIFIALAALIAVHVLMTRTSLGLKFQVLGANARAARHAGFNVPVLAIVTLGLSGALAGLGGATEMLGVLGKMHADWNPGYGLVVVPLVFLARMNGWAVIIFIFFFSMLIIGSESAAVRLGVPQYYNQVLIGLVLIFLGLVEYFGQRRQWRVE
jgi:ABC-type uncharacterized transport system permease subunit